MPAWLIKIVANFIIKAISKRFNLSKINEYVEEDNELDIKVKAIKRDTMKYGRYIEELEKDVAILKSNSHPPVFGKKDKNGYKPYLRLSYDSNDGWYYREDGMVGEVIYQDVIRMSRLFIKYDKLRAIKCC